jgi:cell division transport system ATP-binding protein
MQSLFGFLSPLSGGVLDDRERDIYRLKPAQLRAYRRTAGMVFQDYKLIPYKTVGENIAYAMEICGYGRYTIALRTRELLEKVELFDKRDLLPDKLSGGEAQRVSIARALVHEPATIFADEPTGNLDSETIKIIIDLMKTYHKMGTTIVFATHDPDIIAMVPEAHVIDVGQWEVPTSSEQNKQ